MLLSKMAQAAFWGSRAQREVGKNRRQDQDCRQGSYTNLDHFTEK